MTKKPTAGKRKPRRPTAPKGMLAWLELSTLLGKEYGVARVTSRFLGANEARKVARFLTRFADWAEAQ